MRSPPCSCRARDVCRVLLMLQEYGVITVEDDQSRSSDGFVPPGESPGGMTEVKMDEAAVAADQARSICHHLGAQV